MRNAVGDHEYERLRDSLALLEIAGATFDAGHFMSGDLTPVYFGSAINNFGVEGFLNALAELRPHPSPGDRWRAHHMR